MLTTVQLWIDSLSPTTKARVLDGLTSEGVLEGRNYDEEKRNAGKPVEPPPEPEPIEVPASTVVVPNQIVTTVSRDVVTPVAPIQSVATPAMVVTGAASVVRNPFQWVSYSENYELALQYSMSYVSQTSVIPRSAPTDSPTYSETNITIPTRLWPYNTDFYLYPDSQRKQPYEYLQPQYPPLVNGPLQSYVPPPQQIEPPPRRTSAVNFHRYGRIPDHTSVDDVAPDAYPIVQQVGSSVVAPPESYRSAQTTGVTTGRPVSTTDTSPPFPPPVPQQQIQYTAAPQQYSTTVNTGRRQSKMAFHSYFRPVNVADTPPGGEGGPPQYGSPATQPEGAPRPITTTAPAPTAPFDTGRRPSKMAFHTYFRPTNDPTTPADGPSQPFPPIAQPVQAPGVGIPLSSQVVQSPADISRPYPGSQSVQPPPSGTSIPSQPGPPPLVTGNPWASESTQQQVPPQSYPPPVQDMRSLSLDSGRRPSAMTFHKYFQADHS
jgi:hypothetical protein